MARKVAEFSRYASPTTGTFGRPVPTGVQVWHGVPAVGFGHSNTPTSVAMNRASKFSGEPRCTTAMSFTGVFGSAPAAVPLMSVQVVPPSVVLKICPTVSTAKSVEARVGNIGDVRNCRGRSGPWLHSDSATELWSDWSTLRRCRRWHLLCAKRVRPWSWRRRHYCSIAATETEVTSLFAAGQVRRNRRSNRLR